MKFLDKIITWGLCLFVFLLPWQTRWIFKEASLNDGIWEYGRLSLYGTEILLIVILALGVIRWLLRYQKMNKEERIREIKNELKGIKLWIILLVIWSVLSILWSSDKLLSWYGWLRLVEGIGLWWLIMNKARIGREWRTNSSRIDTDKTPMAHRWRTDGAPMAFSLIIAGVFQSLLAIWQWIAQWSFSSKWLGMAFLNPATFGVSVIDNGVGRFLRAYGSLPHPNILAGFLVICLLLAFLLILEEQSKKVRSLLFGTIATLSMGLFLTFSRAGWLILFICLFIYLSVCLLKKIKIQKLLQLVLLIILVFGTLTYFYSDLVKIRLTSSERLEIKSNQERMVAYSQSQTIIKNHWLLGVGLNQYTLSLYQQNPVSESWVYQPVHDAGLLVWSELGIVGLLLFIMIIISAFRRKSRYWPILLAILLLGCFDHYFRSFYFGIMLWWLVISLNLLPAND